MEEEVLGIMTKLGEKYNEQKDCKSCKSCIKISQKIEQIEQEYTSAQNRAQQILNIKLLDLRKYQHTNKKTRLWKSQNTIAVSII